MFLLSIIVSLRFYDSSFFDMSYHMCSVIPCFFLCCGYSLSSSDKYLRPKWLFKIWNSIFNDLKIIKIHILNNHLGCIPTIYGVWESKKNIWIPSSFDMKFAVYDERWYWNELVWCTLSDVLMHFTLLLIFTSSELNWRQPHKISDIFFKQ